MSSRAWWQRCRTTSAGALDAGASAPGYAEAHEEFSRRHLCRIPYPEPVRARARRVRRAGVHPHVGAGRVQGRGNARRTGTSASRSSEIRASTLITVGGYDEVTPACAERIRARIAGSELVAFPSSAHLAHWEERGAFMACVRGFLANH